MSRVLTASSYMALVVIVCFATLSPSAAAAPGKISGTVINVTSGAAVAGAKVDLTGNGTSFTTASDANGKFAFVNVQAGTWVLRTTALQYVAQDSGVIPLTSGQVIDLTVALQPVTSTDITSLGRVIVRGHRALNTSSAAVISVTQDQYVDTGSLLIHKLLESHPGITIEHFDNGARCNVTTFSLGGVAGSLCSATTAY